MRRIVQVQSWARNVGITWTVFAPTHCASTLIAAERRQNFVKDVERAVMRGCLINPIAYRPTHVAAEKIEGQNLLRVIFR